MRRLKVSIIFFILFLPYAVQAQVEISPQWQSSTEAIISAPTNGQAVQGGVILRGSTGTEGFLSYEVDFSFDHNPTQTWFLVQESTVPVQDDILAVWDTTTITDGEYSLRLRVNFADGMVEEMIVKGVRVRNYSPIETDTPGPTAASVTSEFGGNETIEIARMTQTPTITLNPPSPTPLPTNPAEITPYQVGLTMGKGIAITLGIFSILGTYIGVKAIRYRHRNR